MSRRMGLELELYMTKAGNPLKPADWQEILARAVAGGCSYITEIYTGFPLGIQHARGQLVLDNNCSVLELVALPHPSIDETIENLLELLNFFGELAPEIELHWTSQFAEPTEADYWERSMQSGYYAIFREKQWQHWMLMNSMAFQPAIDVLPEEIPHVLRVLYLTAPALICAFEGNTNWGRVHSPRLKYWQQMLGSEVRIGFPQQEIKSCADYVQNLLKLPAMVLSDDRKKATYICFETGSAGPTVADVMFGSVLGRRVIGLKDKSNLRNYEMVTEEVEVRGKISHFYGLSLPYWHSRLVFDSPNTDYASSTADLVQAIEQAHKLYVEIRHIGTPRNIAALKQIYQTCLKLVEQAKMLDEHLSTLITWQQAQGENLLAIENGQLGEHSRAVFDFLQQQGILPEDVLLKDLFPKAFLAKDLDAVEV